MGNVGRELITFQPTCLNNFNHMTNYLTAKITIALTLTFNGVSGSAHAVVFFSTQQKLANPTVISLDYPEVPNSNAESLVCYIQTADGKTLNLGNICGDPTQNSIRQLLTTKQCQGCNLSRANLSGTNLMGADLSKANLSGANLSGANLKGASLNGTNLMGADLSGTIMPDGSISPN